MKLNNILFAGALMTLAACSGNNDDITDQVAMTVDANIEDVVATRMYDTSWEAGDAIGISVSNNNGGKATGMNVKYTTSAGDGKFTATTPIYFNDNKTVEFSAYYPFAESSKMADSKITVSTKDQANQKTFDYLYGTGSGSVNNVNGITNMKFYHKMAKISFTIKAGAGVADNATLAAGLADTYIVSGLKHDGTFSIKDGATALAADAKAADITPSKSTASLIVLPQTPTEVKLVLTYQSVDYTASVAVPTNGFEAGKNYVYTVTVDEQGLSVSRSTIANWNVNNQGSTSAGFEYKYDIFDNGVDDGSDSGLGYDGEEDLEFK